MCKLFSMCPVKYYMQLFFSHVNIEVNSGTLIVASGLKELVLYLNGS